MLVDGYPAYDYSSEDILSVDEMSVTISILNGLRSQSKRVIPWVTDRSRFTQDVSKFEEALDEAVRSLEELRFQVMRQKKVMGGSDICSREDPPSDELLIGIALLNNAKIRAELSIANPWGQSMLDAGQQETMDKVSSAINAALEILKNSQRKTPCI